MPRGPNGGEELRAEWIRPKTLERFWRKVHKGIGDDACWHWLGASTKQGYGVLGFLDVDGVKRSVTAHRFSYAVANGVTPAGTVVRHRCDTPSCVRPDHLLLGTQSDNMQDFLKRAAVRSLAWSDVVEIRQTGVRCWDDIAALAARFKVDVHAIWSVLRNVTWPDAEYTPPPHVLISRGPMHPAAKLSQSDVAEARAAVTGGATITSQAKRFGVANSTMWQVVYGETWAWTEVG